MRFAAIALIASASIVAAQKVCEAQYIVDACREGIQTQIDKCSANDWICLCDNYTNLLTCYNNCPDSNEKPPVQNQVTQYCLAAEPLKSSSSAAAKTAKTSAAAQPSPTTTGTPAKTTSGSETGFAEGTATATGAESTGAASALALPAGGALAALLGLAGLL